MVSPPPLFLGVLSFLLILPRGFWNNLRAPMSSWAGLGGSEQPSVQVCSPQRQLLFTATGPSTHRENSRRAAPPAPAPSITRNSSGETWRSLSRYLPFPSTECRPLPAPAVPPALGPLWARTSYQELRTYQEHGYPQAPLLGCLLGREVRKAPEIRKEHYCLQ